MTSLFDWDMLKQRHIWQLQDTGPWRLELVWVCVHDLWTGDLSRLYAASTWGFHGLFVNENPKVSHKSNRKYFYYRNVSLLKHTNMSTKHMYFLFWITASMQHGMDKTSLGFRWRVHKAEVILIVAFRSLVLLVLLPLDNSPWCSPGHLADVVMVINMILVHLEVCVGEIGGGRVLMENESVS